jgi:hypothetical protein
MATKLKERVYAEPVFSPVTAAPQVRYDAWTSAEKDLAQEYLNLLVKSGELTL